MSNAIPPLWTSTIPAISLQEYTRLLNEGYLETQSQVIIYKGKQGRFVVLEDPISPVNGVARMVGCVLVAPLACLFTLATCFCCVDNTLGPCCDHLYEPFKKGAYVEGGFMVDPEATEELRKKDFQALGYNSFDHESLVALVQSKQFPTIKSGKYPQHFYMPFYGPCSKLSYIILIPNGKVENVLFCCINNAENKPCNSEEIRLRAEKICAGYKPGVNKIQTVSSKTLVAQTTVYGSMGPVTGKVYSINDKIVST